MTTEAEAIAKQIMELSPPAALRLAADLLERQRPETAKAIIDRVAAELGAALLLAKRPPR